MDFDPEGVAGPGGTQPQSFEEIAVEFDKKIQDNNTRETSPEIVIPETD